MSTAKTTEAPGRLTRTQLAQTVRPTSSPRLSQRPPRRSVAPPAERSRARPPAPRAVGRT